MAEDTALAIRIAASYDPVTSLARADDTDSS
jgi:hypothetical protein